ncbi:MAG TPA: YitT family protein [Bacillota bacterium]|nr:YitT family protein [Bacillota bacterium]
MKWNIKNILFVIIGSLLFALGINYFAIPNQLSEGGAIGITIILHYLFDWSPGIINFLINTVLILVGLRLLNIGAIISTLFGITTTSFFLWLTEGWGVTLQADSLLAPLYAGLLVGVGLGMIFRTGATSGGTQIIALVLHRKLDWSMAKGILVLDIIVIAASSFVIGMEKTLLTLVAVYVGAKVIDYVVDGLNVRKAVTIISTEADDVLVQINKHFQRGVTVFPATGGYSGKDKKVLYAVVERQEMARLHRIIRQIDEHAFVATHDIKSAFGGGFRV